MFAMDLNEIGMLILRLAVAYIYLHGVFMIGSTKSRRAIALGRTSILFRSIESGKYFHLFSKFAFYSASPPAMTFVIPYRWKRFRW